MMISILCQLAFLFGVVHARRTSWGTSEQIEKYTYQQKPPEMTPESCSETTDEELMPLSVTQDNFESSKDGQGDEHSTKNCVPRRGMVRVGLESFLWLTVGALFAIGTMAPSGDPMLQEIFMVLSLAS
eukprot:gnl/MRDRNA2_/MRDRNA2_106792_c0_seq1.p1 gnl/MRDRNA2_/MRDRNA2_106792_c0~~gnl/MRDRNA2_/MRDRNA2_106792_c0_seq1.p1  ORF type:complete len:128 (+),score=19.32 gnl/MRDRNA2_/MRDRNA2_106792_c0_seq1:118-501(+)